MTDLSNPWDRRPDETDKAYHAFATYLDLGPDRSLEKTRLKLAKESPGYVRTLKKWSAEREWVTRAGAYDIAQRAQIEETKADLRRKLLEDELTDGRLLLTKWRALINEAALQTERLEKGETSKIYVEVNIPGYVGMAKLRREIGDQLRRAVGLPERITQSQHTGENGGPVDINSTQTHRVDDLQDVFQKMADFEKERRDAARARRPSSPISE